MMFNAVLSNREHPEYGQVTLPFPFPEEHYDYIMSLLEPLEIGDPLHPDCQVDEIGNTDYAVLKALEGETVNVEEMDYLARRLDSFCSDEYAQFQCMASKLKLITTADFINLTFCCQQATAITDFSKLESAGKDHMININGGSMPAKEFDAIDGTKVAKELIASGKGEITPYGVVFDNGMTLERIYDGLHFPAYLYSADIAFAISAYSEGEDMTVSDGTVIYFPCNEQRLQRALERGGIDEESMQRKLIDCVMPEEVFRCADFQNESFRDLNQMAAAIVAVDSNATEKLRAAIELTEPANAHQLMNLAKHLEDFDFAPGVKNHMDLGKYMIQNSGVFEYDSNLEGYYNYEAYGAHFAASHGGSFNKHGYISYEGVIPLQKLLTEGQKETAVDFKLGGM